MGDDQLEAELRREIRRAVDEARARGGFASRAREGSDGLLGRRLGQLGLLHAGVSESLGGAGGEAALALAVAEEAARDLLAPTWLLNGLWSVHTLAALADRSSAARTELDRILAGGDIPTVCWPGVVGAASALTWAVDTVSGKLPAAVEGGSAQRLLLIEPVAGGSVRLGMVDLREVQRVAAVGIDPTRPVAGLALDETPMLDLGRLDAAAAQRLRAFWLLLAAADCLGAMRGSFDLAMDHVVSREAFGRAIGAFQAVRHRCVDLYVDVETTRAAVTEGGNTWTRGAEGALADALVAAAHATEALTRVAESGLLLHGALGFTYECDAQFYMRRAYGVQATVVRAHDLLVELATA